MPTDIEKRVTSLEVEVRGISEDVKSLRSSVEEIGRKIESNYLGLNKILDERTLLRDQQNAASRRFMISLVFGAATSLGALGVFIITSLSESKIHPINMEMSELKRDVYWSQAMARKAVDETQWSQALMYREMTGKEWPLQKETFPSPREQ
jgi:hypothetical protein